MFRNIKKIIQYREMLIILVQKELKTRYKGSVLGFFWNILNPLLMMLVYSVVFQFIARFGEMEHFHIYILCGLLPWTWHANAIQSGTIALVQNGHLINKIYFPLEILPLVMVLANFIHFLFGMGLLLIFLPFFGYGLHIGLLWLLPLFIIQFFLITGIILILSPLHVFYRDTVNILNVLITMWFFLTPIIYPLSLVMNTLPAKYHTIFFLNPMIYLIQAYHDILYYESALISLYHLGLLLVISIIILIIGYSIFQYFRSRLSEEV